MGNRRTLTLALAVALLAAAPAASEPPVPGSVISYDDLKRLKPYLPRALWLRRQPFFFKGMQLQVGPAYRDYAPPAVYRDATKRFAGRSRIGPDGDLIGYTAGQPFPMDQIACESDPQAGVKIAWNFDRQWEGTGADARFRVSFLRRGKPLGNGFEGHTRTLQLANRVEPHYLEAQAGVVLPGDPRKLVTQINLLGPASRQGTWSRFVRYRSSDGPLTAARADDTWQYSPDVGQIQHESSHDRAGPLEIGELVPDDLNSFSGVVTHFTWECLGELDLFAPVNSQVRAYPFDPTHSFGPSGLSFANDRWELRRAVHVRMRPKSDDHPYARKDLYLDRETLRPLYAFAYDQSDALWKIIVHNGRFRAEDLGWEGVPEPRDAKTVADAVLNVQTRIGMRIEFWDNHGRPIGGKSETLHFLRKRMQQQGI